jgi:hypothetical protein
MRPVGLTYARRPSSTNNRSTIPLLIHGPTAPTRHSYATSSDPDEDPSDIGSPPTARRTMRPTRLTPSPPRLAAATLTDPAATITKRSESKKRNRTSLPAHFQLLAVSPSHTAFSGSPAARTLVSSLASKPSLPPSPVTRPLVVEKQEVPVRPRGRRRETGEPCVADGRVRSRSRDRRSARPRATSANPALNAGYEPDVEVSELELDFDFDDQTIPPVQDRSERGRWREASRDAAAAPGYGKGRSGLLGREQARIESPERPRPRGRTQAIAVRV